MEAGRHAVSKLRRTVTMKITVEDTKGCNFEAEYERLTVNYKRGVDETNTFRLYLV